MNTKELQALDNELMKGVVTQPNGGNSGMDIIAGGGAMQQVKTAYTTAITVQKPRSIAKVVNSVLAEAALAGSSFYYRWPVKNKKSNKTSFVQGPSVDLAMSLARNYGNCVVDVEVKETHSHFLFKGMFVDLETGFTVPRLFRQRKSQDIGSGYGNDRAEDLLFQVGHSKAQRNAIIKAMPGWLVEQVIERARQAELNKIKPENMVITRARILEYFEGYGVTQGMLENKVDKKADAWAADDIVNIKEMASALKDGQVSVRELFPKEKKETGLADKLKKTVDEPKKEEKSEPDRPAAPDETENREPGVAGPEETPKPKEPPVDPWNYEVWKSMRSGDGEKTGFAVHVTKHADTYAQLDQGLKNRIIKKWETVYPLKPFPLNPPAKEIDPDASFKCPNAGDAEVNGASCIDCNHFDGCPAHE